MAAGSIAACARSALFGEAVASGSVFAGLQSAGAAWVGLVWCEKQPLQRLLEPFNGLKTHFHLVIRG